VTPPVLPLPAALLVPLALLGGVALVLRLASSAIGLVLASAEITAAGGLAEISARRGDLTEMAERREQLRTLGRVRRTAMARAVLWLVMLALPLLAGWAGVVYPLAALLWLLPRPRIRGGQLPRS
jgi:hypothetical protein